MSNLLEEKLKNSGNLPTTSPKKAKSKKPKTKAPPKVEPSEPKISFDEKLNEEAESFEAVKDKKAIQDVLIYKIFRFVIVLCCVYLIFLIYGAIITDYDYNDDGQVVAQIMTVDDIRTKREYEELTSYYLSARDIYEEILLLDYRLGLGNEDYVSLASEYNEILDTISDLTVKIQAVDVPTKYKQVYTQVLTFVKTDSAVYIQNVAGAITNNDSEKGEQAIIVREAMYENFMLLTNNMISLGDEVKCIDKDALSTWSPEEYIEENCG